MASSFFSAQAESRVTFEDKPLTTVGDQENSRLKNTVATVPGTAVVRLTTGLSVVVEVVVIDVVLVEEKGRKVAPDGTVVVMLAGCVVVAFAVCSPGSVGAGEGAGTGVAAGAGAGSGAGTGSGTGAG